MDLGNKGDGYSMQDPSTAYSAGDKKEKFGISTENTLRAESPSIFLEKSGRGRRLCQRLRDFLLSMLQRKVNRGASLSPYLNIDPTYLNQGGAEFVFPTDSKKKRSWGEQMFSGIGTSYMCGLAVGGTWGLYEGLRSPDGKTLKLRVNSVLNGCTRRGPSLGNSLGVLALMYCSLDTVIGKLRGGEEDEFNSIGAATLTGMIFKSTAGLRPIAIAGALGGGIATAYHFGEKLWNSRGHSISTPNWA